MTIEDWVDAYRLAWESRDPEAAAALFTNDAAYRSSVFEDPHLGREGVREYWSDVTAGQDDVRVEMGRPFVDGSRVAVEFWTMMKADGVGVTLPGCLLLEFDQEGLCRRLREYWQFTEGSFQPPDGWGQ